jgi:hypothetical protein
MRDELGDAGGESVGAAVSSYAAGQEAGTVSTGSDDTKTTSDGAAGCARFEGPGRSEV